MNSNPSLLNALLKALRCWSCALAATATFAGALEAQSHVARIKVAVTVTGEFSENGSCQVFADGVAVFSPTDSAQTTYLREATLNIAPSGFETHEIWCEPRSAEPAGPPADTADRMFVVMLYAPAGKLAKPRKYQIRPGQPTRDDAPYRAGAALFGVIPQMLNDTMPMHAGLVYLAGNRGTVVVTRVGTKYVVGRFAIRTRLALTL